MKYFENLLPTEAEIAFHGESGKISQSTLPASFAAIYNYETLAYTNQAFAFLLFYTCNMKIKIHLKSILLHDIDSGVEETMLDLKALS